MTEPQRGSLNLFPEQVDLSRRLDEEFFATKPHHTHSCQSCGASFRLQREPTVGVAFIPGFKDQP